MENKLPKCPECKEDYTYLDNEKFVCPMCAHEWEETEQEQIIKDVNGNVLQDGDNVSVVKDLKVKGASGSIKVGTKVKNIRLDYDAKDDHDINCKVDGFGSMKLKSSVVKKI